MNQNQIAGTQRAAVPEFHPACTGKIIADPAELYPMNQYLVPGLLALIMTISLMMPVQAEGPVNLSFLSASEEAGYITADLRVSSGSAGSTDGYLSFWFYPKGDDCKTARPLGWQHISLKSDGNPITMKAAVPYAIITGPYTISAIYSPGTMIPSSCDSGPSARTTLTIKTPGEGTHDMAGTLPGEAADPGQPDYRVDAINGVDTAIRVAPGAKIQPAVTITNAGADDTSGLPVEVHAYLGSEELIPVKATLEPLKSGEKKTIDLSYQIPDTIPLRSFPFYLIADPHGNHGTPDAATNLKRTGGQMSVRVEEPELGCGCK